MDKENLKELSGKQKKTKGGKVIPALCNIAGILILAAVIAVLIPATIPQIFGLQAYKIISGSMEPTIMSGSIAYVRPIAEEDIPSIEKDEIIAYTSGGDVTVHRVVSNRVIEGELITKGDANAENDPLETPYSNVVGRVVKYYPYIGELVTLYAGTAGRINLLIFAVCGALLNIIAWRLRNWDNVPEKKSGEDAGEEAPADALETSETEAAEKDADSSRTGQ